MSDKRPFPLHTGVAEVVAVEQLSPRMRRVRFASERFGAGFGVEQPGEVITLGWPPVDAGGPAPPQSGFGGKWKWVLKSSVGTEHWRNFTVRAHHPAAAAIDVDLFAHGDVGRFSSWADTAKAGDRLAFAGPRIDWSPSPDAAWTLLVADETGLPALQAAVEVLPAGHRAFAVVEVAGPEEERPVGSRADVTWTWAHRGDAPPGTTTRLRDAVLALSLSHGDGQVWGGAESTAMRDIRRALQGRPEPPSMAMRGYWKRKG
ncbi:siderophore-interacting protein [Conexibacter sp. SYSU D00693]|uniref:siderophore-interacting protein n=1 Tax=Conexibacter sp. SYSU D00693 TaxID=2812560 RepID=UPI00196A5D93|nr:siderophore-interacting protein [Conexibacter sp. SYSU D00693]